MKGKSGIWEITVSVNDGAKIVPKWLSSLLNLLLIKYIPEFVPVVSSTSAVYCTFVISSLFTNLFSDVIVYPNSALAFPYTLVKEYIQ